MQSTYLPHADEGPPEWRKSGLPYFPLSLFYRRQFGGRTWKVSVDAGFSCPNADGTLGRGGCVFCNIGSFSPSRRQKIGSIADQIEEGMERLRRRYRAERFIAYFQPATNTHASVEKVADLCRQATSHKAIVGLILGTRPDCLPEPMLDLLAEIAENTWLSVEIGLQTMHDRTLDWMNRGHHHDAFIDAVTRCKSRGLHVGAHVILGLPGESREEMISTAEEIGHLGLDAVKIHNLYVAKDTQLAQQWKLGQIELPDMDQYVSYVADFIERLPPTCVVDRISGDAPPEYLLAPAWCQEKGAIRDALFQEFERRESWQGKLYAG